MKVRIYFLFIALVVLSCSENNEKTNETDTSKKTSLIKDTIILKTPSGRFVNLSREAGNFYVEWLQGNELMKLDSAFNDIERGHAWTPRFIIENENYIVLRAGCGNPCWAGIFLPLYKGGLAKVISEYIAINLDSELVAAIKGDSIEVMNLRSMKNQITYLGKCESAFHGYCIDTAYFEGHKLIYEWKDSLNSKQIEVRELKIDDVKASSP